MPKRVPQGRQRANGVAIKGSEFWGRKCLRTARRMAQKAIRRLLRPIRCIWFLELRELIWGERDFWIAELLSFKIC